MSTGRYTKLFFILLLLWAGASAQDVESLKDTLKVSGSIGARVVGYTANGIENRRQPFSYVLNGTVNISKGEFSIPLSFTYSEQDRSFAQPFNQFGIAPKYKWVRLLAGYQNVNWSRYGMAGHQILGGGVELTPGKFRFGFVTGRLMRTTGYDTTRSRQYTPAFKRTGYSIRAGYGTEKSYIDLVWLQAKDDPNSLPQIPSDTIYLVMPGKNSVLSMAARLQLASFLSLYADAGFSVVNRNVLAPVLEDADSRLKPFNPTIATNYFTAFEVGANSNFKGQNITLNFKRVMPDYRSMGAYFIENDLNALGFMHAFAAFKNKISLNYGLTTFSDNLLNKKEFTTQRFQPMVNFSLNASNNWGLDISWMDVLVKQKDGFAKVNDTLRMDQRNPGLTISPRANWGDAKKYHMVMLNWMNMRLVDNNARTAAYAQYESRIVNIMYSLSLGESGQGYNFSVNSTRNITEFFDETGYGASLGHTRQIIKDKLNGNGTLGMQFTNVNTNINLNLGAFYSVTKKQNAGLTFNFLNNKSSNPASRNFSELTAILQYIYNF